MRTVTLRPMSASRFEQFLETEVEGYAVAVMEATGASYESCRANAEAQTAQLLPDGLSSPNAWLFEVLNDHDESIGALWLGVRRDREDVAYVYDIVIDEPWRGQGYGRATMLAAEDFARTLGKAEIGLNVFGSNHAARQLYESLGYAVTAVQMAKPL